MLEEIFPIKGKTVMITGACGWLGRRMCQVFAACGADLVTVSRSKEAIKGASAMCIACQRPGRCEPYVADFYEEVQLEATLDAIRTSHKIDVLINNAYDMGPRTGMNIRNAGRAEWWASFKCLRWTVRATEVIGKQMRKRGGGAIINVASMYALVAPDLEMYEGTKYYNPPTYSTMKSGLLAFTRWVSSDMGRDGVRINAVCPGAIPATSGLGENSVSPGDPFLERLAKRTCLKRVGVASDLDGTLLLLATAPYITGQAIVVDGGWTVC
jgi:gluconate 5-dehydrogenase